MILVLFNISCCVVLEIKIIVKDPFPLKLQYGFVRTFNSVTSEY